MEREKEQLILDNLKLIYQSENQSITERNILSNSSYSSTEIIRSMMDLHFIETEIEDDLYFLTEEAYNIVENNLNIKRKKMPPKFVDPLSEMDPVLEGIVERVNDPKFKKAVFSFLILSIISVILFKVLYSVIANQW